MRAFSLALLLAAAFAGCGSNRSGDDDEADGDADADADGDADADADADADGDADGDADADADGDADCEGAEADQPCDTEGASCGGPCQDPCQFCNILRCEGGTWQQMEAFPLPCDDDEFMCEYTDGTWDPGSCGHYVCDEPPNCDAIIPGCDCGPGRTFETGTGCVDDETC